MSMCHVLFPYIVKQIHFAIGFLFPFLSFFPISLSPLSTILFLIDKKENIALEY